MLEPAKSIGVRAKMNFIGLQDGSTEGLHHLPLFLANILFGLLATTLLHYTPKAPQPKLLLDKEVIGK